MRSFIERNYELKQLLNAFPALVFFMEHDGTIVWSNRAFIEFFGLEQDAVSSTQARDIFHGIFNEFVADIQEITLSGEPKRGITRSLETGKSGIKTLRIDEIPFRGNTGGVTGLIGFCLDISDQIEMEQFKKDASEQIEKNIGQFAILGDQLRNPLAVIIGLCSLTDDITAKKIIAQSSEIDKIITKIDKGWIESEKVRAIIKKYYDIGASGTHELVARAIHEEYIELQRNAGMTLKTNPSMCSWNELPNRLKDSNLRQAADIWRKLDLIACAIGLSIDNKELLFEFTRDEIELLAEKEHQRWIDERLKKGWTYAMQTNEQLRTHDCIVPWELLPESEREKDRNAIRTLPQILSKVHLKIVRRDDRKA